MCKAKILIIKTERQKAYSYVPTRGIVNVGPRRGSGNSGGQETREMETRQYPDQVSFIGGNVMPYIDQQGWRLGQGDDGGPAVGVAR